MCAAEREYAVAMPDGSSVKMTATEIVERTGRPRKLIIKRLNQYDIRSYERLAMSPEEGARVARAGFKRHIGYDLTDSRGQRQKKIQHEKRVLLGNPEVR